MTPGRWFWIRCYGRGLAATLVNPAFPAIVAISLAAGRGAERVAGAAARGLAQLPARKPPAGLSAALPAPSVEHLATFLPALGLAAVLTAMSLAAGVGLAAIARDHVVRGSCTTSALRGAVRAYLPATLVYCVLVSGTFALLGFLLAFGVLRTSFGSMSILAYALIGALAGAALVLHRSLLSLGRKAIVVLEVRDARVALRIASDLLRRRAGQVVPFYAVLTLGALVFLAAAFGAGRSVGSESWLLWAELLLTGTVLASTAKVASMVLFVGLANDLYTRSIEEDKWTS